MRKSDAVLDRLLLSLQAALPAAKVVRNQEKPDTPPDGGLVVIWDGDPGDPEQEFSPRRYLYEHRIPLEITIPPDAASKESSLSAVMATIGDALAADRTLGGLCDWIEPDGEGPATSNLDGKGIETSRSAELALNACYETFDPLG